MGHAEAFSGGDVVARYRAMRGNNVLHPIGGTPSGCRRRTPRSNAGSRPGPGPREHRAAGGLVQADGHVLRLVAATGDVRSGVLPLDPMAVHPVLRGGARLPEGVAGQLVPEGRHRARQRAGDQGRLRAVRHAWWSAATSPNGSSGSRTTRSGCWTTPRARRMAGAGPDDAAQLDRAIGGRRGHVHDRGDGRGDHDLHDPAGHAVGCDVLRVRGRASARSGGSPSWPARGTGRAAGPSRPSRRRSSIGRPPTRARGCSSACTRSTRSTASGSRATRRRTC